MRTLAGRERRRQMGGGARALGDGTQAIWLGVLGLRIFWRFDHFFILKGKIWQRAGFLSIGRR